MPSRLGLVLGSVLLAISASAAAQNAHPSFSVEVTGSGPPVVLIPGLLSTGDVWSSTVERYQGRYTLHTLTLAGFGGPAPVGSPFLPRVRDELIGYIRAQKLHKPVLIGHSLGGFMAFWVAATAPDLVGGVVAVDGVPFLPALGNPAACSDTMASQAEQIRSFYAALSVDQLIAGSRMALATMITAPADVERAMAWVARSDARAAGIAMGEMITTDLRADIAKIAAPVLLIGATGAASPALRPGLEKAYAAQVSRLPSARVKIAGKARHFVMFDDPQFLFASLDEFLATLPAGR